MHISIFLRDIKHLADITIQTHYSERVDSTRCFDGACRAQFSLLILLIIFVLAIPSLSQSAAKKTDLRILIDVSGSMKKNDPQNLRTPSVRLLIGLIPNGTKAGIWTFGKYVNMQVKLGIVNKQWKKNARSAAKKIHSRGLYTNIESVIKKSTYDWKVNDPNTSRHLILLTDGVVDISKSAETNLKSRNKVIDYYLPKLKRVGVKIHTIALSQQADHELLKLLSVSTDGWYELIEDPKKLHRVFLRIFEKSTATNALPLENNQFTVDKSIKDMTVLSFHTEKKLSKLISPSKKIYSEKDNAETISWFHEDGYDLITITKPEPGDWQLDAPVDKDNRVLVVTNLTLSVPNIPNNVLLNQRILLKAELKQKDKEIKNKKFLKFVKISATKKSSNEPNMTVELVDNGKGLDKTATDGIFNSDIRSPLRSGIFEMIVLAEGPTFKRQRQFLINVFNGLAEIEITEEKEKSLFFIEVIPHKGLLQTGSIDITYQVDNGESHKFKKNNLGLWKIEVSKSNAGRKISFTIKGLRQNNKNVESQMERILPKKLNNLVEIAKPHEVIKTLDKKTQKVKKQKNNEEKEDDGGWLSVFIWVIVINLILIAIAVGIYFFLKKAKAKKTIKEQGELQL